MREAEHRKGMASVPRHHQILKVATLHRVSDYYGPILYDGFGTADQKPQSQEEVYKRFFEDLATAVNILKDYKGGVSFESADFMMPEGKRTPAQWLKFATLSACVWPCAYLT